MAEDMILKVLLAQCVFNSMLLTCALVIWIGNKIVEALKTKGE